MGLYALDQKQHVGGAGVQHHRINSKESSF